MDKLFHNYYSVVDSGYRSQYLQNRQKHRHCGNPSATSEQETLNISRGAHGIGDRPGCSNSNYGFKPMLMMRNVLKLR